MESYAAADEVWAAGLVFVRVAAIVMLLPGLGEAMVPPRVRLSFALLLTLALTPIVSTSLPALPGTVGGMGGFVLRETLIGLMIGGLLRILMMSLAVAGELVSLQTGLSFAQTANPLQAQPGTTVAAFLALLGLTLIFATNTHHLFIGAIADSYKLFAPVKGVPVADAATLAARTVSQAFALGVQLAAPVIVFSLLFNLATGLVGRVMPQFQIFFAATPLGVLLGLSVFALSLGVIGMVWIEAYREFTDVFLRG
ncbi:flagellar biosynthetic protein FliR [Caulobacter sp. 17J65-9]|uniref:flagellar biosynthetic protein FliR n=1 Tax=Caulobacter sp. 17J65-9 TaxID=2709382 RepID=UPI0013CCC594|nr:flagellar type III secretion system protein FliR [Caulobacter sp. 17J65-9]